MIAKGITGKINRLINSATVPKKAERYPLSTTDKLVADTNDCRIGWIMIVAPIIPRPPRITRIKKIENRLKFIFYANIYSIHSSRTLNLLRKFRRAAELKVLEQVNSVNPFPWSYTL